MAKQRAEHSAGSKGTTPLRPRHNLEPPQQTKEQLMLWTIFVILLILWLLGFSFHIAGGLIHILLVIAVVVLVINLISGRRTV
jgi:hypothetical protein